MMVAMPGNWGEGDEITAAYAVGCAAGPVEVMGVITDRYVLPQPAIRATAVKTAPASTNRTRVWPKFMGKSLIQYFPAYPAIVNQAAGA
jgi:hypothetical protein